MIEYLGKKVKVVMDRPFGSKHQEHGFIYPVNYGYIPNTISGDGEEIDAYILGEFNPLEFFEGHVIAIIHRLNDNEDKLVVCRETGRYSIEQIKALTEFQERFFKSEIITEDIAKQDNDKYIEMDFEAAKNEVMTQLEKKKAIVLATSYKDRVTARNMSCVLIDEKIYFQTDRQFIKYNQMIHNPNVALCIDNIQIEGTAEIKGHPLDSGNMKFANEFKQVHEGSFHAYSHIHNEVVIEVMPKLVTLWKYIEGKPLRDFIDFNNKIAYRKYYDNGK